MTEPVTMLTKQQCQLRRMTAKAMDGHGIEYRTIDITESEAALAWALENDFRGDPIVVVGETATEGSDAWTGFRPDGIAGLASRMNGGTQCLT